MSEVKKVKVNLAEVELFLKKVAEFIEDYKKDEGYNVVSILNDLIQKVRKDPDYYLELQGKDFKTKVEYFLNLNFKENQKKDSGFSLFSVSKIFLMPFFLFGSLFGKSHKNIVEDVVNLNKSKSHLERVENVKKMTLKERIRKFNDNKSQEKEKKWGVYTQEEVINKINTQAKLYFKFQKTYNPNFRIDFKIKFIFKDGKVIFETFDVKTNNHSCQIKMFKQMNKVFKYIREKNTLGSDTTTVVPYTYQ
jgi:hypothetical protein